MEEHIKILSRMISCNTVSKKNDNKERFDEFHKILEESFPKIYSRLEKINIDGNIIFKWKGKFNDLKAIALMNHMDTADVDCGKWDFDPLGGEVIEEYICGRGAIDTKGPLCSMLIACEELVKEGFNPNRDIYLMSTRNEEIAGDGGEKLCLYLKENKIFFESLLDEGGAIMNPPINGVNGAFAMIGISEKGHIILSLKGEEENLIKLKESLEKENPFKSRISDEMIEMLKAFSSKMKFPMNFILKGGEYLKPILVKSLSKMGKEGADMIKSTLKFGEIEDKTLKLTIKVSQEDKLLGIMEILKKKFEEFNIEYIVDYGFKPSKISNIKSKGFNEIGEAIKKIFKEVNIAPYRMLAGTDSRHFDEITQNTFRFAPLCMKPADMNMVHGLNEKISIENFEKAIAFYKEYIKSYTS
ncbi:M20/M25/M40 family metallo-hydrolase [uncultured Clostridium sp.]|uniref:M20/M25/M40 family metallo-hydrolase n=1 Tax=uncultured Clostridium sp. TaxID=59620 RepID=UPI002632249D|nr:M20/M25/M40 family metallo-hydrolase [uncultured Clostridium sp.]